MMAHFVDQYVADEMLELLAFLDPLGEYWLAEQAYPVGERTARLDAPLADRDTFVNPGELERVIDPQLGKQGLLGKFIDLQDDVPEVRSKGLGQALHFAARDQLDFLGGWWVIKTSRHELKP